MLKYLFYREIGCDRKHFRIICLNVITGCSEFIIVELSLRGYQPGLKIAFRI